MIKLSKEENGVIISIESDKDSDVEKLSKCFKDLITKEVVGETESKKEDVKPESIASVMEKYNR